MILRLTILLLIVGCAPTTATFYIGMTEEEFKQKNSNIPLTEMYKNVDYNKDGDMNIYVENVGSKQRTLIDEYIFGFVNDTLVAVYRGFWNASKGKEIDYDKYATPPK